jgi:hypothetical protein
VVRARVDGFTSDRATRFENRTVVVRSRSPGPFARAGSEIYLPDGAGSCLIDKATRLKDYSVISVRNIEGSPLLVSAHWDLTNRQYLITENLGCFVSDWAILNRSHSEQIPDELFSSLEVRSRCGIKYMGPANARLTAIRENAFRDSRTGQVLQIGLIGCSKSVLRIEEEEALIWGRQIIFRDAMCDLR